jgi:hypothetical protein
VRVNSANIDDLVDEWLTVPEVADRLDVPLVKAKRLVEERRIIAVRRGEPPELHVPAAFLVPGNMANPAQRGPAEGAPEWTVLSALQGTFTVLADVGFDDEAAIAWMFSPDEALGCSPMTALLAGRKSEVRRVAQSEL